MCRRNLPFLLPESAESATAIAEANVQGLGQAVARAANRARLAE